MNYLELFDISDNVLGSLIDEPALSTSSRRTTRLTVGQETAYNMSLNGKDVKGYVTLVEPARITRLSLLQQRRRNDNELYWLATGIMSPVKLNIDVVINGQRMNMVDLFHGIGNQSASNSTSRDEFVTNCENLGLKFNSGMAMFWQQFGANYDQFKDLIEIFKQHGAQDVLKDLKSNNGSVKVAYAMPRGIVGPAVTSFEVGTVDRTQSARFKHNEVGQGFLNFLDAQYEQLTRIIRYRKSAEIKTSEAMKADGLTESQITALKNGAKKDLDLAGQWTSNWGGAQKRIAQMKDGSFVEHDQYDAVSVPCGRLSVLNTTGENVEIDLWTNKNVETTSVAQQTSVSTGAEEPF